MSSFKMAERQILEQHLGMASGYVLNFSDRTFGEFVFEAVGRDIHNEKYKAGGTSKANKLRTFWKIESDDMVGKLILALVDYDATLNPTQDAGAKARAEKCRHIATRIITGGPSLSPLKEHAKPLNASHLAETQSLVCIEILAALRSRFLQISNLSPQQRGYALEKFLYDLFDAYRFNPRPSFRVVGEHSQIGRGVFITAGCFSADGITAHERLRPSAMVGIDGQDLYYLLERALPLAEILRRKLRWLVETGHFHYPVREFAMELEKDR